MPFRVSSLLVFSFSFWNLLTNTKGLVENGLDGKLLTCTAPETRISVPYVATAMQQVYAVAALLVRIFKRALNDVIVYQRTVMGEPVVARVHLSPQGDTRGSNAPLLVVVGAAAAVVLAAAGGGAGAMAAVAVTVAGVVLVAGGGGDGAATVTVAFLVGAGVGLGPPLASTATAARMQSANATRHTCVRIVEYMSNIAERAPGGSLAHWH